MKLNGTHQLLAYADDVNILGGNIYTLKENAEALVPATREIGLEVSADKTKYMVMSRDQNAGQNHSVRIDNSTFERVEEFKYLGTSIGSCWGNRRERGHWGDIGVDGWIILGWISRRWDVGVWTGLGWSRIETGGGRL